MTWGGGSGRQPAGAEQSCLGLCYLCVTHRYICWIAGSSEWKLTLCVCVGVCVHACMFFFFLSFILSIFLHFWLIYLNVLVLMLPLKIRSLVKEKKCWKKVRETEG